MSADAADSATRDREGSDMDQTLDSLGRDRVAAALYEEIQRQRPGRHVDSWRYLTHTERIPFRLLANAAIGQLRGDGYLRALDDYPVHGVDFR